MHSARDFLCQETAMDFYAGSKTCFTPWQLFYPRYTNTYCVVECTFLHRTFEYIKIVALGFTSARQKLGHGSWLRVQPLVETTIQLLRNQKVETHPQFYSRSLHLCPRCLIEGLRPLSPEVPIVRRLRDSHSNSTIFGYKSWHKLLN